MSNSKPLRTERPYASANGFYVGDYVELADSAEPWVRGYVCEVFGPHSHAIGVEFRDGQARYTTDEKLTRL